jgi:hypothetical protein
MDFFRIETKAPWGDYGGVLCRGFTSEPFRRNGQLVLCRTGPFVPPMTLPSTYLICTDALLPDFRTRFPSIEVRPVQKQHIAEVHWEQWSAAGPELPPEIPNAEPESLILDHPHSPECAAKMGELWEAVLPVGAEGEWERISDYRSNLLIRSATWTGDELFVVSPTGIPIQVAAASAAEWLIEHGAGYIDLKPLKNL